MTPQVEILDDLLENYIGYYPSNDMALKDLHFGHAQSDPLNEVERHDGFADFFVALEEAFCFEVSPEQFKLIASTYTVDKLSNFLDQLAVDCKCNIKKDSLDRSNRRAFLAHL